MKVDGSIKGVSVPLTGGTAARPAPPDQNSLSGAPKVAISAAASQLVGSQEAFDAKRVAEIRQAIEEGRFQVNPERIADGLLESVREFLSGHKDKSLS